MSKKNEDSVERFFRKAVEHYDQTFIAQDWQKMEKLLDDDAAKRAAGGSRNFRRGAITGAGLTGIILILYFLAFDQNHPESRLLTDGSPKQKQAAAGVEAPGLEQNKKESPSAALLPLSDENSAIKNKKEKNPVTRSPKEKNKIQTVTSQQQVQISQHQNSSRKENQQLVPEEIHPDQHVTSENSDPISPTGETHLNKAEQNSSSPIIESHEKEAQKEKSKADNEVINTLPEKELSSKKEKKQLIPSRWSIALVVAPDFSSTQLTRYTTPGKAFGLQAGYHVFNRLTINTGLLKTNKKYTGYGSDYQPPEGYWSRKTNGIVPDQIYGQCEVLEIPVIVQYSLRQTERSKIFVSGGLSSYVMLNESYDYTFETPNPGSAQGWSSSTSRSYPFDVGHLSAGYERQITHKVAIGVEPYFKVPFTGIGWSRIDLFTTGVYFTIRYRMVKKERIVITEERTQTTQ